MPHQNDLTVFVTRPVSAVVLGLSALLVAWSLVRTARRPRPAVTG